MDAQSSYWIIEILKCLNQAYALIEFCCIPPNKGNELTFSLNEIWCSQQFISKIVDVVQFSPLEKNLLILIDRDKINNFLLTLSFNNIFPYFTLYDKCLFHNVYCPCKKKSYRKYSCLWKWKKLIFSEEISILSIVAFHYIANSFCYWNNTIISRRTFILLLCSNCDIWYINTTLF